MAHSSGSSSASVRFILATELECGASSTFRGSVVAQPVTLDPEVDHSVLDFVGTDPGLFLQLLKTIAHLIQAPLLFVWLDHPGDGQKLLVEVVVDDADLCDLTQSGSKRVAVPSMPVAALTERPVAKPVEVGHTAPVGIKALHDGRNTDPPRPVPGRHGGAHGNRGENG